MSAAKVEFLRLDGSPCPPDETPQRFTFRCVVWNRGREAGSQSHCGRLLIANSGHGIKRDGKNNNGGRAQWDFDGNRDAPTFSPSVNCESACGWHGYIRNGRAVDCNGRDEPE